jgi:epoxyqueuosine reductase
LDPGILKHILGQALSIFCWLPQQYPHRIFKTISEVDAMTQRGGELDAELFQADPCGFIENSIKEYVRTSPLNRLTAFNNAPIVDEPVVAFANGDDQIFQDLKAIIGEHHLTPRELIEKYIASKRLRFNAKANVDHIGVVSWALPIVRETRLLERASPFGGSPRYNHTRWIGIRLYESVEQFVASLLEVFRCNAVAPTQSRFFEIKQMSGDWISANWSERHIAYACGLGTFGLNGLIITSRGCAVYLGSAVCDLALTPTPRSANHVANCPFYQDGSCGLCIERCTASAISKDGRSNSACLKNLRDEQAGKVISLGLDKNLVGPAPACGRCSTGLPCEDKIPPVASRQRV